MFVIVHTKNKIVHTRTERIVDTMFSVLLCPRQTSEENAPDRGAEDSSRRTLGVTTSELSLATGSAPILVQDYGGMRRFRGIGALDGGLACPTSVYVVVVSLTQDRSESKRQIKYW